MQELCLFLPIKSVGQESSDSQQWEQKEEKKVSRLLAGHSASTIQILEEQNEELREEVESLRCQLELQSMTAEQHINGNVNGAISPMIADADAALPEPNGTYTV